MWKRCRNSISVVERPGPDSRTRLEIRHWTMPLAVTANVEWLRFGGKGELTLLMLTVLLIR